MKSHFVVDLSDGQSVVSHFLVREKEVRTSARTGSSWLQLQLGDCTGTISGKMWDNFSELVATFECDDVIQVRGRIKLFNGQKEMAIEQIVPVLERDYDLKDFLRYEGGLIGHTTIGDSCPAFLDMGHKLADVGAC